MNFEIKEFVLDEKTIERQAILLSTVFKDKKKFNKLYLHWLYKKNPLGEAIGFDAYDNNGNLVAHYAAIPIEFEIDKEKKKGVLALNTATLKEAEGNGLFKKLANLTYKKAANLEFEGVFLVANNNSEGAFLKYLGFEKICNLEARISFFPPNFENAFQKLDFTISNEHFLKWRMSNPNKIYREIYDSKNSLALANVMSIIRSIIFLKKSTKINETSFNKKSYFPKIYLWIGVSKKISYKNILSFNIPIFLRPSPLSLCFKDLKHSRKFLKKDVHFEVVNFDAY